MLNATLVLVMNSASEHARWFTPSGHVSGGLALAEKKPEERPVGSARASLAPEPNSGVHFMHHLTQAVATVCKDHAIETVVVVAPTSDHVEFAAELPHLVQPVPKLVPTEPSWANLSTAELCARIEGAGMIAGLPIRQATATDQRNPGAISGAQAQFIASGLTPFERQRMS